MLYILLFINIISFILFGIDKRKAVRHQRRIFEFTLLSVTFLGGTVGALLGMLMFSHKISKRSFLLKFSGIVIVQIMWVYLYKKILINR